MMDPVRQQQLKEISERYIQELHRGANEDMTVARKAYFDLIKVLLQISFAALPILATVLGIGNKYVPDSLVPSLVFAVLLFLSSIILGLCAMGFTALAFRHNAEKYGNELINFLRITDLQIIEDYFMKERTEVIKGGMFWRLNLQWFYGQVVTFLIALGLFFWVFYKSITT